MDDIIRRALVGDREAQEECTRQGIVLPCPFCGGKAKLVKRKFKTGFYPSGGTYYVHCTSCMATTQPRKKEYDVIETWNTRPAPLIGHCETCLYSDMARCTCWKSKVFGQSCRKDEYCSSWAPREETDHETD